MTRRAAAEVQGMPSFGRWVRVTWAGWVLGVPLLVALALVGEALGVGGAQSLVGAGMGLGIGLAQARTLPAPLRRAWVASWAIGLTAPFAVTDGAAWAGRPLPYVLPAVVAAGAALAGAWQAALLRDRIRWPAAWALATVVGATGAAAMASAADLLVRGQQIRGVPGALVYLGLVAVGGLILGSATALPWRGARPP